MEFDKVPVQELIKRYDAAMTVAILELHASQSLSSTWDQRMLVLKHFHEALPHLRKLAFVLRNKSNQTAQGL